MASSFRQNGGSATCVIEPEIVSAIELQNLSPPFNTGDEPYRRNGIDVVPTDAAHKWHQPRIHVFRTLATFWALLIIGANDAAYGALIPYIERDYGLTHTVVSLIFLSPLGGYIGAACLNNFIHTKLGQRGIAFIAPAFHLAAFLGIALHPPYPVLVVIFIFAGLGTGLADAAWNSWVGALANASQILGVMHGFYGIGATLSPLIATSLITKAGWPWYSFYYFMAGAAAIELITSVTSFWSVTGARFRQSTLRSRQRGGSLMKEALFTLPSSRVTWLCAFFLLGYIGAEVALGGWIVTFMMQVRNSDDFASGMTATGFWMGITVGRLVLGFITPLIGQQLAVSIYLPITMALELIFWLVPQFYVSAVAVSVQGFFLGPLFPAIILAATKLLPHHLHVPAIGFATAIGCAGGAVLPFFVGILSQAKGVQVLQPIVLALLAIILGVWLGLPRMEKKRREE